MDMGMWSSSPVWLTSARTHMHMRSREALSRFTFSLPCLLKYICAQESLLTVQHLECEKDRVLFSASSVAKC